MKHTFPAFLLLALAVAVLFSVVAGAIAFALARWEGVATPTALSRCGIAFAASLTLWLATFAALDQT
ncbi:putative integral membrane protein [Streptomyces scabiei 87.22]|uniref:Putative integral membrane protein n=1 Tax=Streptomyces scabiei (strain 87.22) TaxID=680198 RepID=C9Z2F6_STRSW|nr:MULTISPECIES: hypothetical protein [Streptomyces]MBP5877392.1 hypothetical protein [Streptomyces sp. LBUM 1477]MDX3080431.1 hypothetical protein [Streptomyces scabiei]MDX3171907.1 hypothetical protein [Streptomyces scabiei]MDX3266615.1 hypothetical protein [Streptomyces scabiei]MDX3389971.1 hypothetical protein [Streptomyces scabiei]